MARTPRTPSRSKTSSEPSTDYDSPWKEVLDCYFERCIAFILPQAHAEINWHRTPEMLDKELQKIVRHAKHGRQVVDKLVKVWLKNGEETWILLHVEVQSQKQASFPKRMHLYNNRIFDRYDREVVSLAILGDSDPDWRPTEYGYGRWGFRAITEFPIVKLLDYAANWQALETNPNPFAIVVLAHLRTLETRRDPANRQAWKMRLIKGLFERGLDAADVRQLFRFIDWIMVLPEVPDVLFWQEIREYQEEKHMPYVSTPERFGRKAGLLEGIEVGLELKFGPEGAKLMSEIRDIHNHELLRTVLQAIKTAASPEELRCVWTRKRRPKKGRRT